MSSSSDKKPGVLGRFLSQRGMGQVITVTIGLIVLCLAFGFINPNFLLTEIQRTCCARSHLHF